MCNFCITQLNTKEGLCAEIPDTKVLDFFKVSLNKRKRYIPCPLKCSNPTSLYATIDFIKNSGLQNLCHKNKWRKVLC
jgi:hypothetical protein